MVGVTARPPLVAFNHQTLGGLIMFPRFLTVLGLLFLVYRAVLTIQGHIREATITGAVGEPLIYLAIISLLFQLPCGHD